MKSGITTFDEHGNPCRPIWTGAQWKYEAIEYRTYEDEQGRRRQVKVKTEVDGPFPLPAKPTERGWETYIYFYRDDGTSPDPRRDTKPDDWTGLPLRIRYRSRAERPLDMDDLRKEFEWLRQTKTQQMRRRLQRIARPVRGNLQEAEVPPATTHQQEEIPIMAERPDDLIQMSYKLGEQIDICCECGPDEDCEMPEGYLV